MTNAATQILRMPEVFFYQAIQQCRVEWIGAAWAGVNASLAYGQTVSSYFSRNLDLNQLFSSAINTGWLLWDFSILSEALQQRHISTVVSAVLFTSTVTGAFFLHFAGSWLYKKTYPLEPLPETLQQAGITLNYSSRISQSCNQAFALTRIVINVAIACFLPQYRLWAGFNVIGLGYSYLKNAQIQWLKISREFNFAPTNTDVTVSVFQDILNGLQDKSNPKQLRFDYEFPLFSNEGQERPCMICLEDTPFNSCPPHAPIHPNCFARNLQQPLETCLKSYDSHFRKTTHKNEYGQYLGTSYSVKLEISKSNFPRCSGCKQQSDNHTLEAQYFDQDSLKGHFTTTVEWTHDPNANRVKFISMDSLWARLGAIYSIFQAALAIMQQRHPDIAGKIATLKKMLTPFDLGAIVHHYWQLYQLLYEKYVVIKARNDTPQVRAEAARKSLEELRLNDSNLNNDLEAGYSEGKILKIYDGRWIPLSEIGRTIIDDLKNALENKDIVKEEEAFKPQTPTGQAVLNRLKQEGENGEIIGINDSIPLSHESILLLKSFLKGIAKKEIVKVDANGFIPKTDQARLVLEEFASCINGPAFAVVVKGIFSASPKGQQKTKQYLDALSNGTISKSSNGEIQFTNEASQVIYETFIEAIKHSEIITLGKGFLPLSPQGKQKLQQYLEAVFNGNISKASNGEIQFTNEASRAIYKTFFEAIDHFEIINLNSGQEFR